jgi:hypothetical protein
MVRARLLRLDVLPVAEHLNTAGMSWNAGRLASVEAIRIRLETDCERCGTFAPCSPLPPAGYDEADAERPLICRECWRTTMEGRRRRSERVFPWPKAAHKSTSLPLRSAVVRDGDLSARIYFSPAGKLVRASTLDAASRIELSALRLRLKKQTP